MSPAIAHALDLAIWQANGADDFEFSEAYAAEVMEEVSYSYSYSYYGGSMLSAPVDEIDGDPVDDILNENGKHIAEGTTREMLSRNWNDNSPILCRRVD